MHSIQLLFPDSYTPGRLGTRQVESDIDIYESRYAQRSGALILDQLTGNKLLPRPNLRPTLTLTLLLLWG